MLWTTDVEMHTQHCGRCGTGIERVTKSTRDIRGDEPYVKNSRIIRISLKRNVVENILRSISRCSSQIIQHCKGLKKGAASDKAENIVS